ncbi:hypothetical protein VITFI_CDS2814 [Vitreoscilla filiformis]|jgi:hypothetical protein|uniref:Uncharacterized protein n=1 Tax=Vitreoscilla filiformis TaxID=63 RepID=A0A221KHS5_VITFI|nr:hypothetical protein VITFI_CDS2814 [Vitreoscilla filiformis]
MTRLLKLSRLAHLTRIQKGVPPAIQLNSILQQNIERGYVALQAGASAESTK